MANSQTIRGVFKRGLRSAHRNWGVLSQTVDDTSTELVFDHFGTRVRLEGQRISRPSMIYAKINKVVLRTLL